MIIYYDETEISEDMFILMGRQSDKRNFYIPIQQHDKEVRKQVCDEIREYYNLEHKPIQDEFGDTSFGYATINADKLNKFLYQIEKGE